MRNFNNALYGICVMFILSCTGKYSDDQIKQLLKSNDTENLIVGAFEAGETGKREFVPLLLSNANNPGGCANIRFKGFSVYQEKMVALKKILNVSPPSPITRYPDSSIIRFYSNYVKAHHITR